jgi:hypothetical protein
MLHLGPDPLYDFVKQLGNERDRGYVLMAHAFIDERLQELLEKAILEQPKNMRAVLRELFKGNNPLEGFPARVQYAKRLYRIPKKLVNTLKKFNNLRNGFAHRARCGELCQEDVDTVYRAMSAPDQAVVDDMADFWHFDGLSNACTQFMAVTAHIYCELDHLPLHKTLPTSQSQSDAEKTAPHPPPT